MSDYFSPLINAISRVTTPEQQQWLDETLAALANSGELDTDLPLAITRARRRVGHTLLGDAAAIASAAGDVNIQTWEAGNAARVALLLKALAAQPERQETIAAHVYRLGDESEKTAFIAGIALYADDDRYKGLALDSGRTNSLILFRTLATNNPYPAAYYDEAEFNQLVLKALFLNVDTDQIVGLEQRVNQDLSRMCEDYYDERTAAQRSIPPDIWLAIAPYASEHGLQILSRALNDDDRAQRYYAAKAINRHQPQSTELRSTIKARLNKENDEHIHQLLSSSLNNQFAGEMR